MRIRGSWRLLMPGVALIAACAVIGFVVRRSRTGAPISTEQAIWMTSVTTALVALVVPVVVLRSAVLVEGGWLVHRGVVRTRRVPLDQVQTIGLTGLRNDGERAMLVVGHATGQVRIMTVVFGRPAMEALADVLRQRCPTAVPHRETAAVGIDLPARRWYERRGVTITVLLVSAMAFIFVLTAAILS